MKTISTQVDHKNLYLLCICLFKVIVYEDSQEDNTAESDDDDDEQTPAKENQRKSGSARTTCSIDMEKENRFK